MSLKMKVKKLARMTPKELLVRTNDYRRIQQERKQYSKLLEKITRPDYNFFSKSFSGSFADFREGNQSLIQNLAFKRQLPIATSSEKAELFQRKFPQHYKKSLARADQICEHSFHFLGLDVQFNAEIPWQQDPKTGYQYPAGFYHDIEIFQNTEGIDIKHVWELNRLQFLIELAKAAYISNDAKYKEKLEYFIADWYEKNSYNSGVAWTSALEVGVRAFSFFWVFNFYTAIENPAPETVTTLLKLLYLSGKHINENLSIYFSPYNHLIGEAAALFMIGYMFPGLCGADNWAKKGWKIMCEQAEKQFHPDGGTVEQATFYHHFTLGFYLQCMILRQLNGQGIPQNYTETTRNALHFARSLTRPDGTMPWIGDNDAARSIYFSYPAHWDFRGFQAIGAVLFNDKAMKHRAGTYSEEAHWLLPPEMHTSFDELEADTAEQGLQHLADSGYTIMRNIKNQNEHHALFDCGPLAAGVFSDGTPSAAHGHADFLSVEIAAYGENLLIDPGFSNYRGDKIWHRYFRSTAAHNTIEIDGKSQAKQIRILNWAYAPKYRVLQHFENEHVLGVSGEHAGYNRIEGSPVHQRTFLFVDNAFWLGLDTIYPSNPETNTVSHRINSYCHFSEGTKLSAGNEYASIKAVGAIANMDVFFFELAQGAGRVNIMRGGNEPREGWIAPTYRVRKPAEIGVYETLSMLPLQIITIYVPHLRARARVPHVTTEKDRIRLATGGKTYEIHMLEAAAAAGNRSKAAFTLGFENKKFEISSCFSLESQIADKNTIQPIQEIK